MAFFTSNYKHISAFILDNQQSNYSILRIPYNIRLYLFLDSNSEFYIVFYTDSIVFVNYYNSSLSLVYFNVEIFSF